MKTIYIGNDDFNGLDMNSARDEDFLILLNEYAIMESPVIYFSAGDAKIKEILIKKDPTFSV